MIYLMRHGQTDFNLLKKFNGVTESKLNATGIEQMQLQAEKLKNVNIDICFCSTQMRARQSCEIIYQGLVVADKRLVEIDCGEFEGTEETYESMKLFWEVCSTGEKGTERFKDFVIRNCDFCDMLTKEYAGKNILIITHSANARVINYYFTDKSNDYDFMKAVGRNGEILEFEN